MVSLQPRHAATLLALARVRVLGDLPGHEFHGNQWTSGSTVFHGTAKQHVESILKDGLKASQAGRVHPTLSDKEHVYVTNDHVAARHWAAATKAPSVAVLEIHLPEGIQSRLIPDTVAGNRPINFKFKGDIKPEWIKGVTTLTFGDGKGWVKTLSSKAETYYVPVILGDEKLAAAQASFIARSASLHATTRLDHLLAAVAHDAAAEMGGGVEHRRLAREHRALGDVVGHEFHGNQWTAGLASAAQLYTDNFIDARKIAYVSEAVTRGGDVDSSGLEAGASADHISAARELVDRIRQAPEQEQELFRGLSSETRLADIESLKPGDTVTMPRISSFSENRAKSTMYADLGGRKYKYELKLEGRSRTLATDKFTKDKTHQEHITHGKFEVVRVDAGGKVRYSEGKVVASGGNHVNYERTIVLRHVGVF